MWEITLALPQDLALITVKPRSLRSLGLDHNFIRFRPHLVHPGVADGDVRSGVQIRHLELHISLSTYETLYMFMF